MDKAIKRVLVRAPNWIGDAVMCLPAVEALKALYPKAQITVLAKARVVPVFLSNTAVEKVIEYEDRNRHSGILGKLRLSGEIKGEGFDLAVLFQNAFDAAFIAFASRVPERVGYARDLRSGLLTRAIPVTEEIKKIHQVYYYLNIVKELGGKAPDGARPRIRISKEELEWAGRFLAEKGLIGRALTGVAPGASYGPAKRWPAERFSALLERLSGKDKGVALIFGGPDDRDVCATVAALAPERLDLSGRLSLRESMSLMARLNIFVTNDSGPMHISSALGVPTVAIFGSTDDRITGPLGERAVVVNKRVECSPCFERTCKYGHYRCLTSIEVDEVYGAIAPFIKEIA